MRSAYHTEAVCTAVLQTASSALRNTGAYFPQVLYYPPPPEGECSGLRMAPHFDYDTLTVLYQDPGVPGGLQVSLHDG
jgi:isopenicillin N synthase-like dioxygenase